MVVGTCRDLTASTFLMSIFTTCGLKLTLLCLDQKLVSQEAFQDYSDVSDVILHGSGVDQDVVDIHNHLASKHVPEHLIDECLEH